MKNTGILKLRRKGAVPFQFRSSNLSTLISKAKVQKRRRIKKKPLVKKSKKRVLKRKFTVKRTAATKKSKNKARSDKRR